MAEGRTDDASWEDPFDHWLRQKLVSLSTDDEVFTPYIKGILEGDDLQEDKEEALQSILGEITENGIEDLCRDILQKWTLRELSNQKEHQDDKVGVEEKLARIMGEQQAQRVTTTAATTTSRTHQQQLPQDHNLKRAILAQYAEVSDGDVTDSGDEGGATGGGGSLGSRNTNAEDVVRAEREKREREKEEAQRKKDKDKEDRPPISSLPLIRNTSNGAHNPERFAVTFLARVDNAGWTSQQCG